MRKLGTLDSYKDEDGNVIISSQRFDEGIAITFHGRNNRIELAPGVRIRALRVRFDGDNGTLTIKHSRRGRGGIWDMRIGEDATVAIGANCTTTTRCVVSAVEGVTVRLGDDVMVASNVQIRADDGHPIFDAHSGERTNPARSISIGSHVWLGFESMILAGSRIGTGSVIGARSVVTRTIPNNCIAAGTPAKVIRTDIAWDRTHLSQDDPPYKPDASIIEKDERFWKPTEQDPAVRGTWVSRVQARVRRART